MTSTDFKLSSRRKNTISDLLLEITLIDRTLYLSDKYVTYTNDYEGLVLDWGDIDTDRRLDSGISSIGDVEIVIANQKLQFMVSATHGNKFSDLFTNYDLDFRPAKIYQIFSGLSYSSDKEQIFDGFLRIGDFNKDEIVLQAIHRHDFDLNIPITRINTVDHPNAPGNNIGSPIPIPFGNSDSLVLAKPIPMILTDHKTLLFQVSSYELHGTGSNILLRWVDEVNTFMTIVASNKVITNNSSGCTVELNKPVSGAIVLVPKLEGTVNNCDDWKNAIDSAATVCPVDGDGDNRLSVKFNSLPDLGKIQDWTASSLRMSINYENVAGAAGNCMVIRYYNLGYDAGAAGYSDGITFTVADLGGVGGDSFKNHDFANDISAHGVADDQSDSAGAWKWDELGSYEIVVEATAGHSFDVSDINLTVSNIEIWAPWRVRTRRERRHA